MRRCGALRNIRSAAFEYDKRFVAFRRLARHRQQLIRLFEALYKGSDDMGVVVLDEVIQVFLDGCAGLIAAGNDMAQTDIAVEHKRVCNRCTETPALRNERNRT